ncbi:MAG: alpha-glucosidase [Lachnospiraceae bacterium]|nr:alpha-glucosidase [Lachnospiraceae bacterium]
MAAETKRFRYGDPIETDAVMVEIPVSAGDPAGLKVDPGAKTMSRKMSEETIVYGLGETVRGINKRGWLYKSFNADDPHHEEGKNSLYASQNFILLDDGTSCCGYYFDHPGAVYFDIGYTDIDMMTVSFDDMDLYVYEIEGDTPIEIVREFRRIIGPSYIPPKWAFGYGQSRWGYKTAGDIREVADKYDELDIPIDMVYMDIDYMTDFKVFTVDPEKFPNTKDFVSEMKERGIHVVPNTDPGVKIEPGYDVYEEGLKGGYFCKKEDGTELVAAVWPGKIHFPDFLNSDARRWFGDKYKRMTDLGIDGFWNDMNEPAIFYTDETLSGVYEGLDKLRNEEMDIWGFFKFKELMDSIDNNPEDYRRFYHDMDGKKIRHDKVHNLYSFNMTRAAGEAFKRNNPGQEILLFSRASFIGAHRYGGVWTGDNMSWWSHLLLNIKQMPSLNMTGFLYSGADTGGFGADTTEDLMMRWIEFSIFTPLFRNHSALGTREQELYRFKRTDDFRHLIELRYALIPYIYDAFVKAAKENDMYIRPMAFDYRSDPNCRDIEDQLLVGDSIMIAPVYEQNAKGRFVYLPEKMKFVRFRSVDDYDVEILNKGNHHIDLALNEVAVFILPGHSLPMAKPAKRVGEIDFENLKYIEG